MEGANVPKTDLLLECVHRNLVRLGCAHIVAVCKAVASIEANANAVFVFDEGDDGAKVSEIAANDIVGAGLEGSHA